MICEKLKQKIKIYSIDNRSIESCGLVVGSSGGEEFVPCRNLSPCPELSFTFSAKYLLVDNLKYIFHSHPSSSSRPSYIDKKYCNELRIPFLIYSLVEDDFSLYYPE